MNKSIWLAASLAALLVVGACTHQKELAEQIVANADAALAAVHDAAAKYAPDQLQSVEAQVNSLKASLAKGNYVEVVASAPAVNTAVANLKQITEEKQTQADDALAKTKQQWRALSADVPKMVAAIQERVDSFSKSRHLPSGMTKAAFESAKAQLAALNATWAQATSAVATEDYAGAVAKGQGAKEQAGAIMHALGMAPG